jgi:hypothetical protein
MYGFRMADRVGVQEKGTWMKRLEQGMQEETINQYIDRTGIRKSKEENCQVFPQYDMNAYGSLEEEL